MRFLRSFLMLFLRYDGGHQIRQQESAMKDDLKDCLTDLEYAKIRLHQLIRKAVTD
jgi:hypothetical protein